jgi:hypothetical protein
MIGTGQRERSEGWLTESQRAGRAAYDWFARNLGSKTHDTATFHSLARATSPPRPPRALVRHRLATTTSWTHEFNDRTVVSLELRLAECEKIELRRFCPCGSSSHTATTFPSVPPSGPSKTPLRCCFSRSVTLDLSLSLSHATRIFSESSAAGSSSRVFPFKIQFQIAGASQPFPLSFPLSSCLSLKGLHVLSTRTDHTQPPYNHNNQNHTETSLHDPFTTTLARSRIIKSIIVTLRSKVFLSAYRSRLITSC